MQALLAPHILYTSFAAHYACLRRHLLAHAVQKRTLNCSSSLYILPSSNLPHAFSEIRRSKPRSGCPPVALRLPIFIFFFHNDIRRSVIIRHRRSKCQSNSQIFFPDALRYSITYADGSFPTLYDVRSRCRMNLLAMRNTEFFFHFLQYCSSTFVKHRYAFHNFFV